MKNETPLTIKAFFTRKHGVFTALFFFLLLAGALGNVALRQAKAKQSSTPPLPPANEELWQDVNRLSLPASEAATTTILRSARTLRLNREVLARTLAKAPPETKGATNETLLLLPLPAGGFAQFRLENSSVLPPTLAAKYPQIQSYRGEGVGVAATMRCDWSPRGFHATIMQGNQLISIQPLSAADTQHYGSFYDHAQRAEAEQAFCQVKDTRRKTASLAPATTANLTLGTVRRTYRIAIATTQEYTNAATLGGGSVASTLASLTTFLNAVNLIYERDLAIRFVLAEGNDKAIYTTEPDPFTNGDATQMLNEVTDALEDKVGGSKYDLGHVLGTGGGGVAGLGVVCQDADKSKGVSLVSANDPVGTGFSLQTLLHEIGHQFNATHTFSAECDFNRNDPTAYEAASGLTIMSYAGACTPAIVTLGSTHFHSASIAQILDYITDSSTGGSCAVTAATGNTAPAVNPGIAFTIPKQTPFALTATGSDADAGDFANLTYSWEQVDAGPTPPIVNDDGPLFRPFNPSSNPTRYFPSLTYILNNANVPPATVGGFETAESLPTDERLLNFNSIVRDNRGGIASEAVVLTVADSGPFEIITTSTAAPVPSGSLLVEWRVNGTNLAPVSCEFVRISLSTDGGQTFPYELANNVPNVPDVPITGTTASKQVTIPSTAYSSKARVKVEAVGNIFFDISGVDFSLTPTDGCPAIANLNPLIGTSGTVVTITGVNFTGVTSVAFPGAGNVAFAVVSDTEIRTLIPAAATSGYITVSKNGCSNKTPFLTVSPGSPYTSQIDDNTNGGDFSGSGANPVYYVNRLTPSSYPATTVEIEFFIPSSVPIGTDLTLVVGSNLSGIPRLVTFQSVLYKTTVNDQLVKVSVPNLTITSGDFLVGFSHVPQPGVFPVRVDDGTLANRSYISANAGTSFTLIPENFVIRGIFLSGAICTGTACTPPNGNTPPVITPAAAVTLQQGSLGSVSPLATVSDFDTAAGALTVTATSVPAGLTVSNLTNTNGVVTARINADCAAMLVNKTITFSVSDNASPPLISTLNYTVNIVANTPPTLSVYPTVTVASGGTATITPSAAPTDNGTVATITAASNTAGFTGTFSGDPTTGVLTVNNAGPVGTRTVTVTATDTCGATAVKTFQLSVVAPLAITSLVPNTIQAKGAGFFLLVNGSGFTANSRVRWNGADRTTTVGSSMFLTATIPATDINLDAAGSANITVFDTGTALTSNTQVFTITAPNPVPTVTTLSPTTVLVGGAAFPLLVNGTNFVSGAQVTVNGVARAAMRLSAIQLSVAISAADIANAGVLTLTAVNPAPGGGASNSVTLPINNPVPGALTLNPTSVIAGSGSAMVTVTGTNFRPNSAVRVNGTARTTMFVSASELKANLDAADVLNAGTLKFTVFTAEPGGGLSPETNFTVNNPMPTLTSLSPVSATAGGANLTLTLTGTNFIGSSQVKFNGIDRATTFVSATNLTIAVTAADLALAGSATITVVNPAPGGGTSNTLSLPINNPAPTLTSLNPTTAVVGSGATNVVLTGTGFRTNSIGRVNGADRATTFVSVTQLQVTLTAADLAAAATLKLSVFTPTPGGGTSVELDFTVGNTAPAITSLNPALAFAGGAAFTLTINGTNFIAGSQVKFNSTNRATTFVSATQLTIAVTAADLAASGTATIAVVNPAPGGGTSNTVNLPINNPVPGTLTLAPNAVIAGIGASVVTVTGTNFRANSSVKVNGTDRVTTFVSATELKVNLLASDVLNAGTLKFTVFTAEPGGGTSPEANFTVNNPAPTLSSLTPASATAGGADFTLTLTGTNFIGSSQVKFNGTDRATTFVSATNLTIAVTAADLALAGFATITVVNPAPGGGTSSPLMLPINNPAPTLTSLTPSSALLGSGATNVILTGTGFRANSIVRVNGTDRTTAFVSTTQVSLDLSAADLSAPATLKLAVFTPTPGGGTSSELNFTVGNPVPVLTTLNPASVNAGGAAVTLTINGTGFIVGSQVKFNGVDRATTFVSATNLTIAVTAADIAASGTATIVVVNPAPGGGTSNTVNLPINNATPGALTLNPNSALAGSAATALTVTGTGFSVGSIIRVNGADRTTTFVSETQLTTQLSAADLANAGTLKIAVNTPAPGGGLSPEANFTVNNPAPNLTGLSPAAVLAGNAAFTLTINGTGFIAGSLVNVNGTNRAAIFGNATQLTVAMTAADIANTGTINFTVVNPAPGGGTSNPLGLPINNPAPTLASLNPASALIGSAGTVVMLTGTDFRANSLVRVNGGDRATTFVSSTQLQTTLTAAELAASATLKLAVFTPTPGGGTSVELNFNVGNFVPTITTLNPASAFAGGAAFTLTINGTNFINGSQVKFNGADRATTFVSATNLTIAMTAADLATPGTATVTVVNPAPGGGTSNTANLPINNPVPGALTLAPNAVIAGSGASVVTVTGTNFRANSSVKVNGTDRVTTFVSVTELKVNLLASDVVNAGTLKFTVFTAEPGGGTSPEANFTISNSAPTLTSLAPASALAGGAEFTLTLTGTSFVNGALVKFNGADRATTFVSATNLTIVVTVADLANAGTATLSVVNPAPSSGASNQLNLPINNPAPTLTSLNPTSAVVGSAATNVTVTGSGFRINSIVKVNGTDRATTFVSPTQLQAMLTAADLAAITTLKLVVFTAAPGGGTSAEAEFTVGNPAPAITSLNPASTVAGGAAFTLTINGSNFINGSQVKFNGVDRTTTFVSATQLTIAVTAADLAASGTITIAVVNPAPGGGTSNTANLPINNPVPGALTLAPNAVIAGIGASVVTVMGTNFRANSSVKVNGTDRVTTFVSATELKVNLLASDVVNAGTLKFTVFTPEPGGGTSPEATFNVNNSLPTLTGLNPAATTVGGADFTLTMTGTNFVSGAQVKFNGTDRATTFVSATNLTIAVTAADIATAGSATITVVNPAPGGGSSNALSLPINNPAPTLTSLTPSSTVLGSAATNVTLTGTGFKNNSVVRVNGADRATTFISATQLQVTLTAADLAAAATLKLSVFTATPGGGTSAELNFTVGNPIPAITGLNPASAAAGGSAFTLTINGSNFINGSQIKFNGADRTTAFISATNLTLEVTAADLANIGTITIAIVNPAPGGGTSNTVNLPINNPAPGAITLNPTSAIVGGSGLALTINGSNFRANSVARVNGADRTTTFVSATNLTVQLTAADLASIATLKITVNTPAPGGGLSPEANFSINNPAPTLANLNPATATAGGSTFFLTMNGTGFLAGTIVKYNGAERAATLVNSTQLTITITAADLANVGSAKIIVLNPAPGGGTSNELTLPINNPAPTNPALTQTSVAAGAGALQLTMTGNGFRPDSVVRVNGANRTTTFVSATELKVALLETDVVTAGTLKLTVFTPEPGGGTSPEVTLTINNPAPTLTSLNPTSAAKGDVALLLTVTGTNFVNGSVVRWNGADRVTTFVSATQLKAAILESDFANEGSANVTVFTPAPGGGTSSAVSFTIRPAGFEADVAPRPNGNGNGTVSIADWTQLGRFVAGLDTVTNGNEFQRADNAPRDAKGDGRITIADWVQAGRYAAGLDPVVSTGGPTQPTATLTNEFGVEAGSRVIRALNGNWLRGQVNSLRIELDAQGNENALGFSLDFDPNLLSFYSASTDNGAIVTINRQLAAQGRLGFIVALPAGQQFAAGTRTALQVQFVPKGGVETATTALRFSDQVIKRDLADAFANTLTGTTFSNAEVTISGAATAHVSAASYLSNDAAGDSIVSAFGSGLATMTASAAVTPLPSLLGGTRVVVQDSAGVERAAPLFFVSPTQVNYLIPPDTANGLATITITNGAGLVSRGVVNLTRTAAGLFSADATGKGFAAATVQRNRADGSVSYEAVTRFDPTRGQIVGVPIEFNPGDELFLALYGTGLRNRSNLAAIKVRMGGVETEVLYAGSQGQYAGLDQVNVRLPRSLHGEVTIELIVDGQAANPVKVQMR